MYTTYLLTMIANDDSYNEEVRSLAKALCESGAATEAKLALLEELIRITKEGGEQ